MSKTEQWIRPGQGKVIALLHGMGAKDAQDYWQAFLHVLSNDEQLADFGLFVWKYPTHVEPGWLKDIVSTITKRTLRETAPRIKLLGAVWDTTYRTQFRDYQDVILICHSMGGLVVKSWIIDVLERGQSESLDTLCHISFYATPHNGAPVATLANWNKQLKDVQLDSPFIEDVGNRWYEHVVAWKDKAPGPADHLYNRYIPHLVIAGLIDRVVPFNNATIRGMPVTTVQGDHSEVIQPIDADDSRYKVWRNGLEETFQARSQAIPPASATARQADSTLAGASPEPSAQSQGVLASNIKYISCFLSYSSEDQEFAKRLHADLQQNAVQCWFAPHDMKIGDKIRDRIETAIQVYDKSLLVLSEHSIASSWVETEVETAFEKERLQKRLVLFPIRLDDSVMHAIQAWAADIRRTRHIGDFRQWNDDAAYQRALQRLLRDLKA